MGTLRGALWYVMGVFASQLGWYVGFAGAHKIVGIPVWASCVGGLVVLGWSDYRYDHSEAPAGAGD